MCQTFLQPAVGFVRLLQATITFVGDPGVGIQDHRITINLGHPPLFITDEKSRRHLRRKLVNTFKEYCEIGVPIVSFNDECDCGHLLKENGYCSNTNCLSSEEAATLED